MTTSLKPNLMPRYAYAEGSFAAVYNDAEAWVFVHGVWCQWPVFDVKGVAKALSATEYAYMFPELQGVAFPPVA